MGMKEGRRRMNVVSMMVGWIQWQKSKNKRKRTTENERLGVYAIIDSAKLREQLA